MHEAGLFRALQPTRWGGGEVKLREFVDAVMQVGRASGSASWVMGVIGVHPWQLALFPDEAQHDVWGADRGRMHSSSYVPSGKAEKVPGGYRISGRWSFSSGSDHCSAVNLGVIAGRKDVGGGIEVSDFRSMLLLAGDYTIDDNWHVAGMKGTGSKDIIVDNAFVPEHRSQSHLDYFMDQPLPGWELNTGPLYRLPWSVVFNFALAASIYGTALGFIDRWVRRRRPYDALGCDEGGPAHAGTPVEGHVGHGCSRAEAAPRLRHDVGGGRRRRVPPQGGAGIDAVEREPRQRDRGPGGERTDARRVGVARSSPTIR